MKMIYVRAGMTPLDAQPVDAVIRRNLFGFNSGNLLFQYSVFRTLMVDDTAFDARPTATVAGSPELIERMNAEYNCAVFPMANAFRDGFNLKKVSALIRSLKIPCVLVGCGLLAAGPEAIREGFPFDDDARKFVNAVLDKSAMLGLRGEYTAEYLKKLGYAPERHFTVIGCPSLFRNGPTLPAPNPAPITAATRFSINTLPVQRPELNGLIARTERQYPDFHLVLQEQRELAMVAFGTINPIRDAGRDQTGYYPFNHLHRDVRAGRVIGFTQARAWFEYMHTVDYSFGSRLHGNLAAVTCGTPAFVFTSDTRTEEICRYANIPHMPVSDLKPDADIRQLLEGADFGGVCRGYAERFNHYVDFLNRNGLDHIYAHPVPPEGVPFDRAEAALPADGLVRQGCLKPMKALDGRLDFYKRKLKKKLKRR